MKTKLVSQLAGILLCAMLMTSCYSYRVVVGEGAKGNTEVTKWNSYLLFGLAPVGVSDPEDMADGAENYTVHTRQSFVNGLVSGVTFGIYTPTTTTVTK
jgi:Bor protein